MIKNFRVGSAKVIESGKKYGNMNSAKAFFPEEYTLERRQEEFLKNRIKLGEEHGFDGHKMFMADQLDKEGTYFELDDDYVEANPNGWSDIREDILIVTDKTPGVVIGHPVADCPVVMACDRKQGIVAIGHCSAELVDKKMPMLIMDALLDSHHTSDQDIAVYVSACAGRSWTYDRYPAWAKDDDIWKDVITEENGLYHIDLKKAVLRQLKERNIQDILMSPVDTITDPSYYSNSMARVDESKKGRNFSGAFFEETKRR